jgi:diguanylate cyclase (GGDEF)-like protein
MPVFARKVEEFVTELDAAVESHLDWNRHLLRCAVSRTLPGDDVMAIDAHCRCRFGRWIGGQRERLNQIDEAATARMFDEHQRMHGAVRKVCEAIMADGAGQARDLDAFEASQRNLIAELARFKTTLLEHSARLDSLTGLPLRYGLEEEFSRFRTQAHQLGKKTALMMIDVDHFKRVNDTFGHAVGDLALKHTATILSRQSRGDEPIFRFGGEEFLQLTRIEARADAEAVAERLLQALRDTPMMLSDGQLLAVRASAGLAVVGYEEDIGPPIARADRALYAAKAAGRDCWRWADGEPI